MRGVWVVVKVVCDGTGYGVDRMGKVVVVDMVWGVGEGGECGACG